MRRHFGLPLATVLVNKSLAVDGEAFVWVDSHTEKTGVGLQKKEREINFLAIFMTLNSYTGLVRFCYGIAINNP